MEEDNLLQRVNAFLAGLTELSKHLGIEINTCDDCGNILLVLGDGTFVKYEFDDGHVRTKYLEVVDMA